MRKSLFLAALCGGICIAGSRSYLKKSPDRYYQWYKTLHQWICIRQDGVQITDYFLENGYNRVAVYGMGELGRLFVKELRDTSIEIPYVIDQNAGNISAQGIKTVTLKEAGEEADVIVVSVVDKFGVIKADIERSVNVPVLSLDDVLFSL